MLIYGLFVWCVYCVSCLSGPGVICLVCLVCVLCVLFVWSGGYMSCLSGLPFFPSYFLHSQCAMYMYNVFP